MASEFKRGFVRVTSNYARLLVTVILSLLLVPLLLHSVGQNGYAIIALFGSTIGLAAMLQEVVRFTMIRELGAAYHGGDDREFREMYNSALALTLAIAALTGMIFAALWIFIDVFRLDGLQRGARALIAARGLETVLAIAVAPAVNMYMVSERMALYNCLQVLIRPVPYVLSAAWVAFGADVSHANDGLILFAWSSTAASGSMILLAAGGMALIDPRVIPSPRRVSIRAIRSVLAIGGWNAVTVTAMNLHYRVDAIIMNFAFGTFGNAIFGYAVQLTSAARRAVMGMTDGLDAVSARMSSVSGRAALQSLTHHSTRFHGMIAFPAGLLLAVLVEPFLQIWIGDRISDPSVTFPPTVLLIQILTIGIVARSISDGWMRILYGAGHIRVYAPYVLLGGALNPILAVILIWILPAGTTVEKAAVAFTFTGIMVVVNATIVPIQGARVLHLTYADMLAPLMRPLFSTLLLAPIVIVPRLLVTGWNFWNFSAVVGAYMAAYAVATAFITLKREDRRLLINAIRRRLGVRPSSQEDPATAFSDQTSVF